MRSQSGCPRSLQVAKFGLAVLPSVVPRPVAPAVSKSLNSPVCTVILTFESGCPRSLQVAKFAIADASRALTVRLPPQSPSR